jgi:hypothetical protein
MQEFEQRFRSEQCAEMRMIGVSLTHRNQWTAGFLQE